MGFYGNNGDSKAFANIENIYGNGNVTKYECIWDFMVTVIARPLLTFKTYKNENVTKYECLWAFMVTVIARTLLTLKTYMEMAKVTK